MPFKKYHKKLEYSYTYGVYPTIDLLRNKPSEVVKVMLNSNTQGNEGVEEIKELCAKHHKRIEYDTKAISSIAVKENTYAIGVFNKYTTDLSSSTDHIVLVNPSNTGNIGTIVRTMLGFGMKDLAIIRPAVDIFEPKVIRSSMGSFFSIRFNHFDSIEEYMKKYPRNYYSFMLEGGTDIEEIVFKKPYSLIFGNEAQGLDPKFKTISQPIFINQGNEIDSLNLSIAAGIGIYISKRNR